MYLDFRLEVMVIGVPRNGSGRPMEDGLGLELGTSAALGLEKMTRQQFAISKLNKSKCKFFFLKKVNFKMQF